MFTFLIIIVFILLLTIFLFYWMETVWKDREMLGRENGETELEYNTGWTDRSMGWFHRQGLD